MIDSWTKLVDTIRGSKKGRQECCRRRKIMANPTENGIHRADDETKPVDVQDAAMPSTAEVSGPTSPSGSPARNCAVSAYLESEDAKKRLKEAEEFKARGNNYFKEGHYNEAAQMYTDAIDVCTVDDVDGLDDEVLLSENFHIYYSNRAFCHLKLENFGSCIMDAEKALSIKPNFPKALYRRANAYMCLAKWPLAMKDFQQVCKMQKDPDAESRMKECQKQIKAARFAAAISTEESVTKQIDPEEYAVASTYEGPVYTPGKCTPEFFRQLIAYIKTHGNVLHIKYAFQLALDALEHFKKAPTLRRITVPQGKEFTICGDVHGQFYDLLNIFEINGMPSESNPYLFNGDFIDRGSFSVEVIFTMMAAKLAFPDHFHMSRGNHETRNLNKVYGFEGEVRKKYNPKMYELFCEIFC
eukprot:GDKH01006905.1.p1 GENE.GDKH01006905.1~~GDKH01006905.1.p1  ORF type:complete len:413 (-),score=95.67 GDKH01006905.1:129-1367(-)